MDDAAAAPQRLSDLLMATYGDLHRLEPQLVGLQQLPSDGRNDEAASLDSDLGAAPRYLPDSDSMVIERVRGNVVTLMEAAGALLITLAVPGMQPDADGLDWVNSAAGIQVLLRHFLTSPVEILAPPTLGVPRNA